MTYPSKTIILFPMHKVAGYRQTLAGIDDALVVHRHPDDTFAFALRPVTTLTPRSYGRYLASLAADLDAGYTLFILGRDAFIEELTHLALVHARASERDGIECAAQVVAKRTMFQIREALDASDPQHAAGRYIIARRPRDTRARPGERDGLNCRHSIPTPRSEQLWLSIQNDLLDVRSSQHARAAWERWTAQNRPDLPRAV